MQNKAVIRLFAIAFALAALFELSFTFVTQRVESKIEEQVNHNPERLSRALDSLAAHEVYDLGLTSYTYKEVKNREMNLGLDLRGGMNVIMEVSVRDVLIGLVGNPEDAQFTEAIARADAKLANSQEAYVALFFTALDEIRGDRPLRDPALFGTMEMNSRDDIGANSDDATYREVIEADVEAAIANVYTVLKARIDQTGVVQPNIQRLDGTGRILVELPGVKDPARIQRLLQTTARLEFWRTYQGSEWMQFIVDANERLKTIVEAPQSLTAPESDQETSDEASEEGGLDADFLMGDVASNESDDEAGDDASSAADAFTSGEASDSIASVFNPLGSIFQLYVDQTTGQPVPGAIIGTCMARDTGTINSYLDMPEIRNLIPANRRHTVKFAWARAGSNEVTYLLALRGTRDGEPELDGSVIVDARQEYDQANKPVVTMAMNGDGARIWQRMTKEASEEQPYRGHVAVMLDNLVYSFPVVNGEIAGGRTEISGGFSVEEATDLANVLKAGRLPVPARVIQSDIVGPSLGQEAITASMNSFLFALLIVLIYMVFYYSNAGVGASLALLLNMVFVMGFLDAADAVLTLPGMAGIVLTIGMAVDANVLIYDRIREELAGGKALKAAIADGYKASLSAILDANITTLLTAVILYTVGTGPIRGFGYTLILGILSSLFTSIFITRLFFEWRLGRKNGESLSFSTSITKGWFANPKFDFMSRRKMAYIISGVLLVVSLGSLFTKGLSLGVDFDGGRSYQIRFDQPVEVADIAEALSLQFVDDEGRSFTPTVKTLGSPEQVVVTTNYRIDENGADVEDAIKLQLFEGVQPFYVEVPESADFLNPGADEAIGLVASRQVGPTVADDIKNTAVYAILFSLIAIFVYLLARFSKWQFSLGAVAATVHDTIIVLGAFSLLDGILPFQLEADQAFVAAILTVIGYSLNDTVVVFDRIREYFANTRKGGALDSGLLNRALNGTLSRTFNTSMTTIIVLLIIFIFGGEVLRGFIFAILLGIVVGTYSSLFIASPVMFDSMKLGAKKGEK